jgi:aminopeptidase YwaD
MTTSSADFLAALEGDAALWTDFLALCDFGGRLAGTPSEAQAQAWCSSRLDAVSPGSRSRQDPTPYAGWTCHAAELIDVHSGRALDAVPLLGTASTPADGVELEVIDLGRGTPEQIREAGDAVRGRAVLVAHEYPFASVTVHRRVKLAAAQDAGAAAFLIAQPEPGVGPVSGSSGRGGGPGIPAMGISAEAAAVLRVAGARVRLRIAGEDKAGLQTNTLVLDLPGRGPERVVLSAHIDGHPLAESAIDNATGVAVALALARAAGPSMQQFERGLTICIFSAEEWALQGSRAWIAAQDAAWRANVRLNLNLDSLAGSQQLTALTSGFPALGPFLQTAAAAGGHALTTHLPLMPNSDHASFAAAGIPAVRLLAGFDEPHSSLRLLLTPADTRALVQADTLRHACRCAGALLWTALSAGSEALAALNRR